MRNNNDTAAGLGANDRMFNMPINQTCGTVYMKEEDIQTQPTVSEGEVNEREEDMSRGEVSAGAMTTKKGGAMLDPWYGARRVFMPRRIISEGDDSSKTTKVTRKYFWRCDVNKGGNKLG